MRASIPTSPLSLSPKKAPVLDKDVVVLFTNDVHCGIAEEEAIGYAGLAAYKKSMEADNYVILADAGDATQGGPIALVSNGEYIIDIMNYVGYDVACPGNHDFDYGMDRFFELSEKAEFPYVSANFVDLTKDAPVLDAYKIFDFNGIKIAFVGICTPLTITTSTPKYFQNDAGEYIYGFCQDNDGTGVYTAVQTAVDAARAEGAKYVIALAHLGDELLSSPWTIGDVITNTSGIDVFIDGHSHSFIDGEIVKNVNDEDVFWVQTGTKFSSFGKLVIGMDGSIDVELITDYAEKDADSEAFIADIQSKFEADINTVVAHSDAALVINMPDTDPAIRLVRNSETNLGDIVADAYRTVGQAEIAITNGGGIRADIPAGDITYSNILTTSPFGNTVCVIEATGQQIVDALEMGAYAVPDEFGGFLQVSGLSYEIHSYLPSGVQFDENSAFTGIEGDVRRVQNVLVNGEPIDLEKIYTVAGLDYIFVDCGDGYTQFKDCTVVRDMQMTDNQILSEYLANYLNGVVPEEYSDVYGQGRITIINGDPTVVEEIAEEVIEEVVEEAPAAK